METQPVDPSGVVPRLGPYRLHGVLGEGGMGVVHLGVDGAGRAVAVKVLRDHVAHDPVARARLAREVETLRRVDHPAIAPVLDADVTGSRPYLVTRYVPGEPLDVWISAHGPLHGDALRRFGLTLVEALQAIHAAGVVHRDLKPGNVLVANSSPVVIDFGIAHVADESRLTSTGLVMGTPGFLAPELLDGRDVSTPADVWGFAATFVVAATGRPPFGRGAAAAVLDRVHRGAADLSGVDGWAVDLVARMLDPDPVRRPRLADVHAFLADPASLHVRPARPLADVTEPVPQRPDGPRATEPVATTDRTDPLSLSGPTEPVSAAAGGRRVASSERDGSVDGADTLSVRDGAGPAGAAAAAPHPSGTGAGAWPSSPASGSDAGPRTRVMPAVPGPGEADARAAAGGGAGGGTGRPAPDPTPTVAHPIVSTQVMPAVRVSAATPPARPAAADPGYARFGASRGPVPPGTDPAGGVPAGSTYGAHPDASGPYGPGPVASASAPVSRRSGTLLAVGILLVAVTAYRPGLGLLVGVGWSWSTRFVERVGVSLGRRRAARGPRDRDVPLAVLSSPAHLVGALLSAVVTGVLPLLVGVAFAFGLDAISSDVNGVPMRTPTVVGVAAAAAVIVAWWGPGGWTMRRGSRVVARAVAPGVTGARAAVGVLLAAAVATALATASSGYTFSWWPLDGLLERVVSLLP